VWGKDARWEEWAEWVEWEAGGTQIHTHRQTDRVSNPHSYAPNMDGIRVGISVRVCAHFDIYLCLYLCIFCAEMTATFSHIFVTPEPEIRSVIAFRPLVVVPVNTNADL